MNYDAFADKKTPGDWRVEAINFENEGNVYIAVFSGPGAQARAQDYAQWQNEIWQRRPVRKAS